MNSSFIRFCLASGWALLLLACGGGGGTVLPGVAAIPNGLPLAAAGDSIQDIENTSSDVALVRHVLDYGNDAASLIVTTGRLDIDALTGGSPIAYADPTLKLTFNGETLSFVDGLATDSAGRVWSAYLNTIGDVSATAGVFHYDYGGGSGFFDTEGFFAFGFQTDPTTVAGLGPSVTYRGDWFGFGVVTDAAGTVLQNESIGGGIVTLTLVPGNGTVTGDVTGSFDRFGRVDGTLSSGILSGNSFAAVLGITCGGAETCTSNSILGGGLYGASGEEASGIIGFDAHRTDIANGTTTRLVSTGGFTADAQ